MILFALGLLYRADECRDCPGVAMVLFAPILGGVGVLLIVRPFES